MIRCVDYVERPGVVRADRPGPAQQRLRTRQSLRPRTAGAGPDQAPADGVQVTAPVEGLTLSPEGPSSTDQVMVLWLKLSYRCSEKAWFSPFSCG